MKTSYPNLSSSLSNEEKQKIISEHFAKIMQTLWLDLSNDSLQKTPDRVAKMYVEELFSGLDASTEPEISTFENSYGYNQMLLVKNIKVMSACEHHFVPFVGEAFVGYIPNGKVIGLSKVSRIVDYFSRRPQVQERLTEQIHEHLVASLGTQDVMVLIRAKHFCMIMRGVEDINSETITSKAGWDFMDDQKTREEFLSLIRL